MRDDTFDVDEPESASPATPAQPTPPKEGLFRRVGRRISGAVGRVTRGDFVNLPNVAVGLLVLLVVWFLIANASPVRVVFWLWSADIPKWLCFVLTLALGVLLAWLWGRRGARRQAAGGEEHA